MILGKEGATNEPGAVQEREQVLRDKIHALLTCNLEMSPHISGRRYSLVAAFYCTKRWRQQRTNGVRIMNNIGMMLEPEGYLFLSALRDTAHYVLERPGEEIESLPCVPVTRDLLHDYLRATDYRPESIAVHSIDTPSLARLGIPGILFCTARKR